MNPPVPNVKPIFPANKGSTRPSLRRRAAFPARAKTTRGGGVLEPSGCVALIRNGCGVNLTKKKKRRNGEKKIAVVGTREFTRSRSTRFRKGVPETKILVSIAERDIL